MARGLPSAPVLPTTAILNESLRRLKGRYNIGKRIGERVETILLGVAGVSISESARRLSNARDTVKANRRRWQNAYTELLRQAELFDQGHLSQAQFDKFVESVLEDLPRSGRNKTFTIAQEQKIVALATEEPCDYDIPVNEWTNELLANVAIAKKIVETISTSQVRRILKKSATPSA
jgi:hypothetical protein